MFCPRELTSAEQDSIRAKLFPDNVNPDIFKDVFVLAEETNRFADGPHGLAVLSTRPDVWLDGKVALENFISLLGNCRYAMGGPFNYVPVEIPNIDAIPSDTWGPDTASLLLWGVPGGYRIDGQATERIVARVAGGKPFLASPVKHLLAQLMGRHFDAVDELRDMVRLVLGANLAGAQFGGMNLLQIIARETENRPGVYWLLPGSISKAVERIAPYQPGVADAVKRGLAIYLDPQAGQADAEARKVVFNQRFGSLDDLIVELEAKLGPNQVYTQIIPGRTCMQIIEEDTQVVDVVHSSCRVTRDLLARYAIPMMGRLADPAANPGQELMKAGTVYWASKLFSGLVVAHPANWLAGSILGTVAGAFAYKVLLDGTLQPNQPNIATLDGAALRASVPDVAAWNKWIGQFGSDVYRLDARTREWLGALYPSLKEENPSGVKKSSLLDALEGIENQTYPRFQDLSNAVAFAFGQKFNLADPVRGAPVERRIDLLERCCRGEGGGYVLDEEIYRKIVDNYPSMLTIMLRLSLMAGYKCKTFDEFIAIAGSVDLLASTEFDGVCHLTANDDPVKMKDDSKPFEKYYKYTERGKEKLLNINPLWKYLLKYLEPMMGERYEDIESFRLRMNSLVDFKTSMEALKQQYVVETTLTVGRLLQRFCCFPGNVELMFDGAHAGHGRLDLAGCDLPHRTVFKGVFAADIDMSRSQALGSITFDEATTNDVSLMQARSTSLAIINCTVIGPFNISEFNCGEITSEQLERYLTRPAATKAEDLARDLVRTTGMTVQWSQFNTGIVSNRARIFNNLYVVGPANAGEARRLFSSLGTFIRQWLNLETYAVNSEADKNNLQQILSRAVTWGMPATVAKISDRFGDLPVPGATSLTPYGDPLPQPSWVRGVHFLDAVELRDLDIARRAQTVAVTDYYGIYDDNRTSS